MPQRSALLDLLRGLAILGMIVFHTAYDLEFFWHWHFSVDSTGWWLLARTTATTFLLVSGMSMAFSEERLQDYSFFSGWEKRLRRMLPIALGAICVSIATYIVDPQSYVRFGILHLILVSRLLLPFLKPLGIWNIVLGILFIMIGLHGPWLTDTSLLLPLGFVPPDFVTVDYFPILPWGGALLIGMGCMKLSIVRRILSTDIDELRLFSFLQFIGRRSLLIYLIHQPVVMGVLWVILK